MTEEQLNKEWQKAIEKSLDYLRENGWDNDSTIYNVVHKGKNYPPKEVYRRAIDYFQEENPSGLIPRLKGGKHTNKFIQKHGFTVIGGETIKIPFRICKIQMKAGSNGINYADEVLADNRITGHIDYVGQAFEELKKDDIVLVHKGSHPYCLVKIVSKINDKSKIRGESFGIDYHISKLSFYSEIPNSIELKKNFKGLGPEGSFAILTNKNTTTYKFILSWLNYLNPAQHMEKYIELLRYKKQIILQGPPGTGKTKLAKEIAEVVTNGKEEESIVDSIDNFFKTFSPTKENIENRQIIKNGLTEFQDKFPRHKLKELKLEDYVLGTDDLDGFCYWLEYGLPNTGKYNGQADKGKIYWSKSTKSYKKSGFVKNIEDDELAMKMVAELLYNIANENFKIDVDFPIGKGFVLKVLNTYHPEKYFPINNEKFLDKLLKIFGEDFKSLNYIQKNVRAMEIFIAKKKENNTDVTAFEFMNFLFHSTNLNGTIVINENKVTSKGSYKVIQFHPSYSYEDFVRGVSVESNDQGEISYVVKDRILIDMANEALSNPKSDFVLIIDEINRANLSSVLGELIYSLEYRYDSENPKSEGVVESLYNKNTEGEKPDRELKLPKNLYIIGTMNSADRSVGQIDYAVRRRFAFVDVLPKILNIDNFQKASFQKVSELFVEGGILNDHGNFIPSLHLSDDYNPEAICLGHSYFIGDDYTFQNVRLPFEIKPILKEYLKDGILKKSAEKIIDNL